MTKYAVLIVLLLSSVAGNAQKTTVEIGVEAGISFSSVYHTDEEKNDRNGLHAATMGVSLKIAASKHVGIRTLLLYDRTGWGYDGLLFGNSTGNNLMPGNVRFKQQYLNLPVMAEYCFGHRVRIILDAGIFAGLLLKGHSILYIHESQPPDYTSDVANMDDYHRFNVGLVLGAGIQFPISNLIKLDVHARNMTGFTNLLKYAAFGGVKMNLLAVSGGLVFQLD